MIRVTCAIIRNEENEILVVQRGEKTDHPLKWEFPGGKVHKEETDEEGIIREVKEELSMDIVICGRLPDVQYDYGFRQIQLVPFVCDTLDELPVLSEHIAFKWVAVDDLHEMDFSEADILVADIYLSTVNKTNDDRESGSGSQEMIDDSELQGMVNAMMSMQEAEWIALSAIENPVIFKKLIEYSFLPDKRLAFRASWTLSKACDKFPGMIEPYLNMLIEGLNRIENESTRRSFLRIISLSEIGRLSYKHHGILADHCFNALGSGTSAIAVKAYSMEILYKLALIYPELTNELAATLNMLRGEGSAGVVARGSIILKKLATGTKDRESSPT